MRQLNAKLAQVWSTLGPNVLPFADAATKELPLGRLMRLSLFQVSVGMSLVLLTGTLNRVMIVELGVSAWLVALMISLPILFAPARALIGHKSDTHRSVLGWRRVPYIWFGTLMLWGGLAIMPFSLLLLSDTGNPNQWFGHAGAALAFLLMGAGLHTSQTAGLALATDLAPEPTRPRVVALLYVMLLVGMVVSALAFSLLLDNFTATRLIQVIQGAAVASLVLNCLSLWKQEARNPDLTRHDRPRPRFADAWRDFIAGGRSGRLLIAVGLGTAAFSMQDVLLEPYGAQILGLSVSETTVLTALLAGGTLIGFALAAPALSRGMDPCRLAALGALAGLPAFAAVLSAGAFDSAAMFRIGSTLIGFGVGLFVVGTLTAAMDLASADSTGLAVGAWGAVQATAAGVGIAAGGIIRDTVTALSSTGALGAAMTDPATGYNVVYNIEIILLFATLAAIGPLVRYARDTGREHTPKLGLAELPN